MGPITLAYLDGASAARKKQLAEAMYVEVDSLVHDVLNKIASARSNEDPYEFAMPAERIVFSFRDCLVSVFDFGDKVFFELLSTARAAYDDVGLVLFKRTNKGKASHGATVLHEQLSGDFYGSLTSRAFLCDILLSLMNEPRLIKNTPPPRNHRRRARRILGDNVPAFWTRVSWTIGEEVAAKGSDGTGNFRMPLHFCRGGWMYLPEGKKGDEWCPIRKRWRSWRRHSWKGHPDFGIRLHNYAPEVEPEGVSKDVISLVRKRATEAAKKAAIRAWEQQQIERKAGKTRLNRRKGNG